MLQKTPSKTSILNPTMLFPQLLLPPQLSLSLLRQFRSFSNARLLLFKKNWMVHIWDMRGGCRVRPKLRSLDQCLMLQLWHILVIVYSSYTLVGTFCFLH
uniref:Uncharacterized protein n=1 Tax=Salix viminalis TaxID=40686 RepID=A0A6N2M8N3_SALVM